MVIGRGARGITVIAAKSDINGPLRLPRRLDCVYTYNGVATSATIILNYKLWQKIKSEYDRMDNWYKGEETVHRNSTKTDAGRAAYPADWGNRKRYVKTRDGACYLCKGSRDNDKYYFYRPRDGRHLNKSGKDFALYDQVHHIVPISKGGTHDVSNLVFLCNLCHEDQHLHLLRRRATTLERKSKQSRNPALKTFWTSRLNDVRRRLSSLEQHRRSTNALRLHRLSEAIL